MKVSISTLKDYLRCPQIAYNKHVLKRGPPETAAVLEVGTLFHEAMESRLRGAAPGKWVMKSFGSVSEDARALWNKHKLWLAVDAFVPDPGWEVVATEYALEAKGWGEVELQGRLDAIVRYNGKYWSLQWKTYDGQDLLGLQERVRLSFHEVAYQWLAEQAKFQPWGGTILGAAAKLPGYRLVGGKKQEIGDEERAQAVTIHYLARPPQTQAAMVNQLMLNLYEMEGGMNLSPTTLIRRNYDQCFGPFGRSRCPFFSVCHEGASLYEPPFVIVEDRYSQNE